MAELFFEDERMGIQDPRYNNQLQNESFSDLRYQDRGEVHPPLGFPTNTGNLNYNIHQDPPENWRENIGINTLSQYPQPHLTNMRDISGEIGEYGQRPGEGFNEEMFYEAPNKGFQFPNFGITGILQALGGKRTPENQKAYEAILASQGDKGWGTYKGNPYQFRDGKIYSDLDPYGSHADSLLGSKSIEARDQKKIDWALGRLDKFKDVDDDKLHTGISKRLFDVLISRGVIDESGNRVITPAGIDKTTSRWETDAAAPTYTGPKAYDFDPSIAARTEHYTERPGTREGYIDPGKGSYGPWKAEGGRIGYANGEFVDEDVNIQGPGFDVNENIEMASAPNPLAELNAFSLEIFKKPFDQLDDDERNMLFEMMNDQAGMDQGEGIASLV